MREIKQLLYLNNWTFNDLFKILDSNSDDLVTISEFSTNLD